MAKVFLLIVSLSILTGCASLNSEFNCPAKKGIGCKSIQEVNELVNDGVLDNNLIKTSKTPKTKNSAPSFFSIGMKGKPARSRDKVLSIWLAPYEDANGNYHDASTVHTVIQDGAWLTNSKVAQ